jgi:hypothetical protein
MPAFAKLLPIVGLNIAVLEYEYLDHNIAVPAFDDGPDGQFFYLIRARDRWQRLHLQSLLPLQPDPKSFPDEILRQAFRVLFVAAVYDDPAVNHLPRRWQWHFLAVDAGPVQ